MNTILSKENINMKVKLAKIYNALEVFRKLLNQELPVTVSYQFTKLFKNLNTRFNMLETSRLELVKEFGESQENGDVKVTDGDNKSKFLEKFNELLETEIDLDWKKISIEDLGPKVTMTVPELNSISYLFNEFDVLDKPKKKVTKKKVAKKTATVTT